MMLIIDNNILFSLMNPKSMNALIFSNLDCDFFAPTFVIKEFNKYKNECLRKSGLSKKDFDSRKELIFSKINFVEYSEFKLLIKKSLEFSPDGDDAPYFALALKLECALWSNDKLLKNQNEVEVLSTKDILELIF